MAVAGDEDVVRARSLLAGYRARIDNIDAALVYMLTERFRCTEEVSRIKAAHGLPSSDLTREAEQAKRLRAIAGEAGLNPDFVEKHLNFIIREVVAHHDAIARGEESADLVTKR